MGNCCSAIQEFMDERKPKAIRHPELKEIVKPFILSLATYKKVRDTLASELEKGLSVANSKNSSLKMLISYVQALPDGSETGTYMALDLGGTNFRILSATIQGSQLTTNQKIYPIGESFMTGPGPQLFDFLALCVASFVDEYHLEPPNGYPIPIGFTFSFPCKQEGLTVGRLITWTKGFSCPGVEGQNVVKMLQEAINRRGDVKAEVVALINDTVGCLMSCAFTEPTTCCGAIFGTGTNACYIEDLQKVEMWDGDRAGPNQVIINTEWGGFGDNGCLNFVLTAVDKETDGSSINPGRQIYEKMISGLFIGEVARNLIVKGIEKKLLFRGYLSPEFSTHNRFYTKYLSEIEQDSAGEYTNTKNVLEEMGVPEISIDDLKFVRYIAQVVSERAAYLAAAGIAALLNKMNRPLATVAVDGSLYRYHPSFSNLLKTMVLELTKEGQQVRMLLSEDGSGKGAAIVAAVASRMKKIKIKV